MKLKTLLVVMLLLSPFCLNAENKKLTMDQFIELYVQNTLITEKYLNEPDTLKFYQDQLFDQHQSNRDEFMNFLKEFDQKPEQYSRVWQRIILALDDNRKLQKDSTLKSETQP